MSALTSPQLHILRHSLGYDDAGYLRSDSAGEYRNHFVSCSTPDLDALCATGLMRNDGYGAATGGDNCYRVTDAGKAVVRQNKPARPKFTRSQQRYRDFLNLDWGITFREYLAHLQAEKHPATHPRHSVANEGRAL